MCIRAWKNRCDYFQDLAADFIRSSLTCKRSSCLCNHVKYDSLRRKVRIYEENTLSSKYKVLDKRNSWKKCLEWDFWIFDAIIRPT